MSQRDIVSGYVHIPWKIGSWVDENRNLIRLSWEQIEALPLNNLDDWPVLPREIFHCSFNVPGPTLDFRGNTIHFGMTSKNLHNFSDWTDLRNKFENLLRKLYWDRALLILSPESLPSDRKLKSVFYQYTNNENFENLTQSPPLPTRRWDMYTDDPVTSGD